jgi:hypothetical protein
MEFSLHFAEFYMIFYELVKFKRISCNLNQKTKFGN